jgi:hypothetical protein
MELHISVYLLTPLGLRSADSLAYCQRDRPTRNEDTGSAADDVRLEQGANVLALPDLPRVARTSAAMRSAAKSDVLFKAPGPYSPQPTRPRSTWRVDDHLAT